MEYFLLIVILLFLFGVFDLMVGVSNDAVNFLNSSIGSKVANYKTIMIVASIGILLGAISSGGMMEVARKGIFNPQNFAFAEVMIIFMAVMITDILLLDLFNTLGMPTSTTVSIVFEILGAAFAVAVVKVLLGNEPMNFLFNIQNEATGVMGYMNWTQAIEIVVGIFLSVIIAFTVGALVMYLTRLFFTFNYHHRIKSVGVIWGGISVTSMLFFLIYKGLGGMIKNVDEKDMNALQHAFAALKTTIENNLIISILLTFVISTLLIFVMNVLKMKIMKFIVLFGTFALAMAFAGNDLVNFIGVPIAGFQSYMNWISAGSVDPEKFMMTGLTEAVPSQTYMLLLAGIVMTLTLWFSKKARSVTETEVNLGSQYETEERFKPNFISRFLVDVTTYINDFFKRVLPSSWMDKINNQFAHSTQNEVVTKGASFDLVRASVNLTIASLLIAIATTQKLPLSTTYVSFMVAMGTSLADRAWGRESAVYRVAGVLNVIFGWFMTAIIAASVAGLFAILLHFFGVYALLILVALVGFTIYRSSKYHELKLQFKEKLRSKSSTNYKDINDTVDGLTQEIGNSLEQVEEIIDYSFNGIKNEDKKALKKGIKLMNLVDEEYRMVKSGLYKVIKNSNFTEPLPSQVYVIAYDLMQEIIQSINQIIDFSSEHVKNNHKPLSEEQLTEIENLIIEVKDYFEFLRTALKEQNYVSVEEVQLRKVKILNHIEDLLSNQVEGVASKKYGFKNSSLYFTYLMEIKDIVAVSARFLKLFAKVKRENKIY